jgi:hypothetical protein
LQWRAHYVHASQTHLTSAVGRVPVRHNSLPAFEGRFSKSSSVDTKRQMAVFSVLHDCALAADTSHARRVRAASSSSTFRKNSRFAVSGLWLCSCVLGRRQTLCCSRRCQCSRSVGPIRRARAQFSKNARVLRLAMRPLVSVRARRSSHTSAGNKAAQSRRSLKSGCVRIARSQVDVPY